MITGCVKRPVDGYGAVSAVIRSMKSLQALLLSVVFLLLAVGWGDELYAQDSRVGEEDMNRLIQSSAVINTFGVGVDYTINPGSSRFYGRLYLGRLTGIEGRVADTRRMFMGGLTLGLETLIYPDSRRGAALFSGEVDGLQIYTRIGPGVGLVHRTRSSDGGVDLFAGPHLSAAIGGVIRPFSRTAFYAETGGTVAYFHELPDVQWVGGPELRLGFMLFGEQRIRPFNL